jgi:CDP-6-deoxy-D-xylo-4-hexulose-3-dehydrase
MSDLENLVKAIHDNVGEYCQLMHNFEFNPEQPVVRLHEPTFSADEINVAIDVLLSTRVTMGSKVKSFEKEFATAYSHGHGVMNNSGSSANLLAVAAIANVATEDGLKPGDEVIVPALSWSTTVWPLIQYGLIPVVVDINPETFNIDPEQVERAIGPKTRAIMPVHVYGNPCDMGAIVDLCRKHSLILIEDCCEALGARFAGTPVGKFGRVGTFSFYFSHHMTTLEGGICVTDDFQLAEMMRILRAHGWVRELDEPQPYLAQFPEFDPRFLFVNLGYNLRATELQGAMGSVQLPKLEGFIDARRENTREWQSGLAKWGQFFDFQQETANGRSSCFGFPLVRKVDAPFALKDLTRFLNQAGIETRPIICGNIARQPAMKMYEHRVVGDLRHSSNIMANGFSFGNHQAVGAGGRAYVAEKIEAFFAANGIAK